MQTFEQSAPMRTNFAVGVQKFIVPFAAGIAVGLHEICLKARQ
jgi:hypothetical protein